MSAAPTTADEAPPTSRRALVIAAVIAVVIEHLVPFGGWILYPFTLLATWVHEMGHGVTALLVGGTFSSLDIFRDASGLAHINAARGFPMALSCMGGLLAPPLVGAATLAFARGPKRARVLPSDHALPAVRQLAVEQCDLRALGELDRLARVPRDGRLGGDMNGVSTFHRDGLTGQISMNKYGGNIVRK